MQSYLLLYLRALYWDSGQTTGLDAHSLKKVDSIVTASAWPAAWPTDEFSPRTFRRPTAPENFGANKSGMVDVQNTSHYYGGYSGWSKSLEAGASALTTDQRVSDGIAGLKSWPTE
ncbi:uncharacterized protein CPUR_06786 [Claviceps purpurea 20.1]|uniref:Uncharacterized protein n=1 Tax=Claviceps purpurea (strain 20.1) TaxID=1111077 RepID=M1WAA5_CLAP2|nr:uncharacterized protein CPUR_06786 [Claviceps purpurea 20.1]